MENIFALPDECLEYISHESDETDIRVYARVAITKAKCPYCGAESEKAHSRYTRKLKDLPVQGKKVTLVLESAKYFCPNKSCARKTFAPQLGFFARKATRTSRLEEEIMRVAVSQSSLGAARYLRGSVADISKSTICNLLKKTRGGA